MEDSRPSSPAARCLRILWAARLPFVTIVAVFSAAALVITGFQPTLYSSEALLSIKPPPEVLAEIARTSRLPLGPDGLVRDANDPDRQTGPGRYAPRLVAPGLVTLAARDAGILDAAASLDQAQAARWATADRIDGADLIRLVVWQPAPDAAQKLAEAIVARALAINRRDESDVAPAEVRRILTVVDPPTRPSAPSYPRRSVNLSVGVGLGVLAAAAFAAVRHAGL
jgi:hypothetical protein